MAILDTWNGAKNFYFYAWVEKKKFHYSKENEKRARRASFGSENGAERRTLATQAALSVTYVLQRAKSKSKLRFRPKIHKKASFFIF